MRNRYSTRRLNKSYLLCKPRLVLTNNQPSLSQRSIQSARMKRDNKITSYRVHLKQVLIQKKIKGCMLIAKIKLMTTPTQMKMIWYMPQILSKGMGENVRLSVIRARKLLHKMKLTLTR